MVVVVVVVVVVAVVVVVVAAAAAIRLWQRIIRIVEFVRVFLLFYVNRFLKLGLVLLGWSKYRLRRGRK